MSGDWGKPTRDRPLLVGLLVDVSGSMLSSIQNADGRTQNRLESFRDSLQELAGRARELSIEEDGRKVAPLVSVFAYGFGFGNPLAAFFGSSGPNVRDLLELPGDRESTVPINRLAEEWDSYQAHLEALARSMFGNTPMAEGFRAVATRISSERERSPYTGSPILFVLSDGEPTDAGAQTIVELADGIKQLGALVVSCYVTDHDIATPRHLYGEAPSDWPAGARLMFDCASEVPPGSSFENYLREYSWELEAGCRLFNQINQSEILSEFMKVVLSPLSEEASEEPASPIRPGAAAGHRGKVFVSYSHADKKWLDRLQVHLRPMERAGIVERWDDTRIRAGGDWKREIADAISSASVAVLLVTADFLASDFIVADELPPLLEAAERRGLVVLPVIVGPSQFSNTPSLARFQAVNSPDRPLQGLRKVERERVLKALADRIQAATDS